MTESKKTRAAISRARTLKELGEFWDTHSLDDYWDETHEVEFEIRTKRRQRVTLDPDVYSKIQAQAHIRGVEPETLVNLWLSEPLKELT